MALNGWLLLVVFLLMQAGTVAGSACRPAGAGTAETGAGCAPTHCCCSEAGDSAPACACLENPAGNEQPAPLTPPPPGGGRDLLPSVVWVEPRACARPTRTGFQPPAHIPGDGRTPVHTSVPLALRVRYCAFQI